MFTDFFKNELLGGIITAKPEALELKEGERRIVSILFADIKGFTAISEQLDPEQIRAIFDNILKLFTHCIKKYGGYVDKYQGDLVMALFGAKKANEEDAQRAIYCGLEMITQLNKFNDYLSQRIEYKNIYFDLGVRIGINTGLVTTGKVGEEREGDFTVYGDAVNIASRMESNAPINQIMLPAETMELVKNDFYFQTHGKIIVKGKALPIDVYTVTTPREKTWKESRSIFIGRKSEINTLISFFQNQEQQLHIKSKILKSVLIGVKGEAGMGKSRLIQEFIRLQYQNASSKFYAIGNASASIQNPYRIFISLIRRYFGILDTDNEDVVKFKFQNGTNDLLNFCSDTDLKSLLKENIIFIASLLGLKNQDAPVKLVGIDLQVQLKLAIRVFVETLVVIANDHKLPFVILVQDLHWADETSISVVTHLLDTFYQSKNHSLIFILSYRPDYSVQSIVKHHPKFHELSLQPLKMKDASQLIQSVISKNYFSETVKTSLLERAAGNPFYLEELASMLNNSQIKDKGKSMQLINEFDFSVPGTLNKLVLSRIDQLREDLKRILQWASVIGRYFHYHTLKVLQFKLNDNTKLDEALSELVSQNFIQPVLIEENASYVFRHVITQEVAYDTILLSNKKIIHSLIAEIIEDNYSENKSDLLYELAYHYDKTENSNKAIHYLSISAEKAREEYNNETAINQYKRLLKYIENDGSKITSKIDILNNMADVLIILGHFDWALHHLIQASEIAENIFYYNGFATSLFLRGHLHNQKGEFEPAIPYLEQSINICRQHLDKRSLYKPMSYLNTSLWHIAKFKEARMVLEEKIQIANGINDSFEVARTQAEIATLYIMQNIEIDKVIDLYSIYISECKKIRREYSAAIYSGNLGYAYEIKGDYERAFALFNYRLEYSKKIGNKSGVCLMLMNKGTAYLGSYEYSKALKCLNQSIKGYLEIKSIRNIYQLYAFKAFVLFGLKKYAEAKKWALKSREILKGKTLHYDLTKDLDLFFIKIEYEMNDDHNLLSKIEDYASVLSNIKEKADIYYDLWKTAADHQLQKEKKIFYLKEALGLYNNINHRKEVVKRIHTLSQQLQSF
jgi:class 3 adenylate cyclase/tetratricopeptide (TPR) repeat protein